MWVVLFSRLDLWAVGCHGSLPFSLGYRRIKLSHAYRIDCMWEASKQSIMSTFWLGWVYSITDFRRCRFTYCMATLYSKSQASRTPFPGNSHIIQAWVTGLSNSIPRELSHRPTDHSLAISDPYRPFSYSHRVVGFYILHRARTGLSNHVLHLGWILHSAQNSHKPLEPRSYTFSLARIDLGLYHKNIRSTTLVVRKRRIDLGLCYKNRHFHWRGSTWAYIIKNIRSTTLVVRKRRTDLGLCHKNRHSKLFNIRYFFIYIYNSAGSTWAYVIQIDVLYLFMRIVDTIDRGGSAWSYVIHIEADQLRFMSFAHK